MNKRIHDALNEVSISREDTLKALLLLQQSHISHLHSQLDAERAEHLESTEALDTACYQIQELLRFITDQKMISRAVDAFTDSQGDRETDDIAKLLELIQPYYEEYVAQQN